MTGHQHPAHDWRETTKALPQALARDARCRGEVVVDPETLADDSLSRYDVLLLNYCNWEREGLSDSSRENLVRFVKEGGGLVLAPVHDPLDRAVDQIRRLPRWICYG